MSENIVVNKNEAVNIRSNKNEYSFFDKAKDTFTKGFKLNRCYQDHWEEMRNIFKSNGVYLFEHGPLVTINELKISRIANELSALIKDDPRIREMAKIGVSPDELDYEKVVDGRIFIALLRIYSEYTRQKTKDEFKSFILNPRSTGVLSRAFNLRGTILNTDKEVEEIVKELIKGK